MRHLAGLALVCVVALFTAAPAASQAYKDRPVIAPEGVSIQSFKTGREHWPVISGSVKYTDGEDAAGLPVLFIGTRLVGTVTDSSGVFVGRLEPGIYSVAAVPWNGKRLETEDLKLVMGDSVNVDFVVSYKTMVFDHERRFPE